MAGIEQELGKQLNKIDTNKINWLEREEIDNFLLNEKKVQKLWNTMQENFETQSEKLQEYKENVWRICERILENENINLNQWKILLFYLKHFHNENAWAGRNIIKSVVEWNKWNRYQEVVSSMIIKKTSKHENTWDDEKKQKIDERFNNLPWTKEIKADRQREQNLKECNRILGLDGRLNAENMQWLQTYKDTPGLDLELSNRIETRLNLEKCYQLLEVEELTTEDLKRLDSYKDNPNIWLDMQQSIKEKISMQGFKKCNQLLESQDLSQEDIQWLNEYKANWAKEWRWLTDKIDNKICTVILASPDRLSQEDIQWLNEYKKNWAWYLSQDIINKIEQRLKQEATDEEISSQVNEGTSKNRLANLDSIDTRLKTLKPNRKLIIQNIKTPEQVTEKITIENISQYLPLNGIDISDANKCYLTNNFQAILARHLCFHPNYQIGYWKDPKSYITGISINDIVFENNLFENAANALEKLKKNNNLNSKINTVMNSNNHILFDLWFKYEISLCQGDQKKWEKLYNIFSWVKNLNILNNFIKTNWFISEMYNVYLDVRDKQKDREAEISMIKKAYNTKIQSQEVYIFTINQLKEFKKYYHQKWWEDFDKVYEASQKFYNSDFVKSTWLPNCLHPSEYFKFVNKIENVKNNISLIEKKYEEQVRKNDNPYVDALWQWYSNAANLSIRKEKINEARLDAARQFVTLWMRSPWKYRPTNFMWFPLRRNDSKWRTRTNVEEIIRDTFWEWISDKRNDFKKNISKDWQKAAGDLAWLIGWTVLAALSTASWWWVVVAWFAFEAWSRISNWLVQEACNTWEFALSKLWVFEDKWSNRVDDFGDSFLMWIWLKKRDANWNPVNVSLWEFASDFIFSTASNIASFGLFKGWKIFNQPYLFATLDNFASKPLFHSLQAWTNAALWNWNNGDIWFLKAFWNQLWAEFSQEWLTQKLVGTFVMWATISWMGNFLGKVNWGRIPSFVWKINECWEKIRNFLNSKWLHLEGDKLYTKDGQLVENVVGSELNTELQSLNNEYMRISLEGWKMMRGIVLWPLVTYNLLSESASPQTIVGRRISAILTRLKSAKKQSDIDNLNNLLAKYREIERDLASWKISLNLDESASSPQWDSWWNPPLLSNTPEQVTWPISNEDIIGLNEWA